MQKEKFARLAFLTVVCAICFNFPMLRLFSKKQLVLGVPQLYFCIFVIWLLIIIATYFTLRSKKP